MQEYIYAYTHMYEYEYICTHTHITGACGDQGAGARGEDNRKDGCPGLLFCRKKTAWDPNHQRRDPHLPLLSCIPTLYTARREGLH